MLRDIDLDIRPGETVAFVGPSGRGQDDDLLAAAALLRGRRRAGSRSTASTSATMTLASLRRRDRHRAAGRLPLRRHDPREHRLRPARRDRGRDRGGGAAGAAGRGDRRAARRAGHGHRRARREALRRAEAAPGDRPHVPEEPADPDPRRGDLGARHRDRAGHPAVAGRAGRRAAPRWSSPTGWRRSRTPTASWWSTRPASPSRAATRAASPPAASTAACTTRSSARSAMASTARRTGWRPCFLDRGAAAVRPGQAGWRGASMPGAHRAPASTRMTGSRRVGR